MFDDFCIADIIHEDTDRFVTSSERRSRLVESWVDERKLDI